MLYYTYFIAGSDVCRHEKASGSLCIGDVGQKRQARWRAGSQDCKFKLGLEHIEDKVGDGTLKLDMVGGGTFLEFGTC